MVACVPFSMAVTISHGMKIEYRSKSVRVWVRAARRFEVSGLLGAFSSNQKKKTEKKGKTNEKFADAIMHIAIIVTVCILPGLRLLYWP